MYFFFEDFVTGLKAQQTYLHILFISRMDQVKLGNRHKGNSYWCLLLFLFVCFALNVNAIKMTVLNEEREVQGRGNNGDCFSKKNGNQYFCH